MNLSCLLSLMKELPSYAQLVRQVSAEWEGKTVVLDAAKPYLIAALYEQLGLPIMVIIAQPRDARKLYEQLQVWCSPSANVYYFPELDFHSYDSVALYHSNTVVERLQTLSTLAFEQDIREPPLIVASLPAVMNKTTPKEGFVSACHVLKQGMTADPLELLHRWQNIGYEMENMVELPGTMSHRGGIVDIFPPDNNLPVRIEFFGNRVESMRFFSPTDQRSTQFLNSLTIVPAKEVPANGGNILDYLQDNGLLIIDSPQEIEDVTQEVYAQIEEQVRNRAEPGERFSSLPCLTWDELSLRLRSKKQLVFDSKGTGGEQSLPFRLPKSYGGKLDIFLDDAKQMIEQRQRVVVVSHQANRLAELLQEQGIHAFPTLEVNEVPPSGSISLVQGSLAGGWIVKDVLTLLTDAELFGFVKQARQGKRMPLHHRWLFPQLMPGNYVVHIDHGIARFGGLIKKSDNGIEREYLILEYAGNDRLYVPTEHIERVSRYVGGVPSPTLNRLGTSDWERTKKRVKQSIADIAQELLALYAQREVSPGFAFSEDTLWQQELEASFPYMETPDQLETIIAVKEDMEEPKPMDRLICGDVGYGKTEVAVRAAFKAIMNNKQVAILVPTTVLAQQHFITFGERLGAFPIKVEMLSRFCSAEKEKVILEGLASGVVDVCIGTHRLLQKDVVFKDLGLVIIDEEQQFGVVQKEKLKQMRKEVDVLTLSATPIPRTLHMSLTGLRDMNIMETPPEQRLAVKTYVGAYDEALVRRAILHELERNGQVFFVHNRVNSIAFVASKLQSLVTEARITIAHGQMAEEELEKVMADFIAGKSDVLVTTTIVQLGLDMPNVNTLIVDHADKFGLTQLYQLRGRVGRGINQAYAYFLFDKNKQLTYQAHERLRAIFEATELGVGFSIAMKDLEIRGAGNLLGVKQSGHIAAVGFDLYCRLLAEAVEELKADKDVIAVSQSPEPFASCHSEGAKRPKNLAQGKLREGTAKQSPSIALPLSAYIPEEYVADLDTRLSLYRRLAKIERIEEVGDIAQELEDRFGSLPQPVRDLLYVVEIKALAAKLGVESIFTSGNHVVVKFKEGREINCLSLPDKYGKAIKAGNTQVKLDIRYFGNKWPAVLREILESIAVS
ncbi:MAG: transcription-repair coupling factor [Chloroflexi bacterium CG_4_10_14_0_8_um_filter_46_9]|nr:MAG: transcription-repair coupling factor [Chloroflexi bacterium CG_4_10_14_0_8_um_filter_46_9]